MLRKRNEWLYRQPNLNWKTLLVFLNGAKLQYVDSYEYLGMFIHVRNDDLDIVRQLKSVSTFESNAIANADESNASANVDESFIRICT